MTRIVYQEKCLICIFFVQKVCRIFHELYVGKLLGVAVKQSPNDLLAEGILEDISKLRDLDHQLSCFYQVFRMLLLPRYANHRMLGPTIPTST